MTARRLGLIAALAVAIAIATTLLFWRYVAAHRPPPPPDPADGHLAPGAERLLSGLVFRDCGLAPSPDGRFLVVAVRRRDTNGDGRITVRDAKAIWLIDRSGETTPITDDRLVWQDKPIRWSPDGRLVALAVPGLAPQWTYFDPPDIIVYDPEARREIARHANGINPLWLADGRLAFQRENAILIVNRDGLAMLPIPKELEGRNLLRYFVEDPWRRRIIASYSGIADVRLRTERMVAEGKPGRIHAWSEDGGTWSATSLPLEGYAARPAEDGLYHFVPRGDPGGQEGYALAQDGVDLWRDGHRLFEDVALNGLFDHPGLRALLLRRDSTFDLVRLDADGREGGLIIKGLKRHGATWVAEMNGRIVISAVTGTSKTGPDLYELRDGELVRLADGPVTQPFLSARGVYCIRAAGERPGELLRIK